MVKLYSSCSYSRRSFIGGNNMRISLQLSALVAAQAVLGAVIPPRDTTGPQFENGQPIDGDGKGGPILGTRVYPLPALRC